MSEKLLEKVPAGIKRKKKKSMIGIDPLAWMNVADTGNEVIAEQSPAAENMLDVEVENSLTSEPFEATNEDISDTEQAPSEPSMASVSEDEEVEDMDIQQAEFGLNGKFKLEGPITIADVAILHEKFKTSFEHESDVEIDCSDIDGVDAAALQLLVACAFELDKQDKKLIWKDPSDSMLNAVTLMGLQNEFKL